MGPPHHWPRSVSAGFARKRTVQIRTSRHPQVTASFVVGDRWPVVGESNAKAFISHLLIALM
jgi:hypothetical protein